VKRLASVRRASRTSTCCCSWCTSRMSSCHHHARSATPAARQSARAKTHIGSSALLVCF
jgi:hypothetical protein